MRNLKRVLSLALALVMMLSLMIVGASAAEVKKANFTDADEIAYNEAVDVMVALEVIEGTDTGAFNPKGVLTREAAAKILCYMLLGPTNAENLTTNTSIFTDVAAGRWSAGYISYCANLGILAGTGDGSFNPEGELTGVAFGKMLLVALGYDPTIQGYVGKDWATSIAADMVNAGIAVNGVVLSEPLTREQAAQMSFQTLTADMVRYTQKPVTVTNADGSTVVVGAGEVIPVTSTNAVDYNGKADGVQQFCEKYFDKLTKTTDNDDFGRPGGIWKLGSAEIGFSADTAIASFTSKFSKKELYDALGNAVVKAIYANDASVSYYLNGQLAQYDTGDDDDNGNDIMANRDVLGIATLNSSANRTTAKNQGGQGVLTEIYVDDDDNVTVVVTNTYLAQVSGDYNESREELTITPVSDTSGLAGSLNTTLDLEDFGNLASFNDEDYVLITVVDDGSTATVKTIALAETVDGTVTGYTKAPTPTPPAAADASKAKVILDGTTYNYSYTLDTSDVDVTSDIYSINEEAVLILDAYGFVIGLGEVQASSSYVFLKQFTDEGGFSGTYIADAYFTDGTHETITLDRVDGDRIRGVDPSKAWIDTDDDGTTDTGKYYPGWYTYSTTSNGRYRVVPAANGTPNAANSAVADTTKVTENGKATINAESAVLGTSNTVLVVKDGNNVKTYTGIRNMPTITATDSTTTFAWAALNKNGYASYVFVDLGEATQKGANSASSDLVFILSSSYDVSKDSKDNTYRTYDAIVNGTKQKLNTTDNTFAVGLHADITYDENGYMDTTTLVPDGGDYVVKTGLTDAQITHSGYTVRITGVSEPLVLNEGCIIRVIGGDDGTKDTDVANMATGTALANKFKGKVIDGNIYAALDDDGYVTSLFVKVTDVEDAPGGVTPPPPPPEATEIASGEADVDTITAAFADGDAVTITGGALTLDKALSIDADKTLTVEEGGIDTTSGALTVAGTLTVSAGGVTGTGGMSVAAGGSADVTGNVSTVTDVAATGSLEITGDVTTITDNNGTLEVTGNVDTITANNGTLTVDGNVTTEITDNASGKTLHVTGTVATVADNSGTLTIDGNVTTVTDITSGTVTFGGTVGTVTNITDGAVTFEGAVTTVTDITDGTVTFKDAVTSVADISGGTVNFEKTATIAAAVTLGGTINLTTANSVLTIGSDSNAAVDLSSLTGLTGVASAKITIVGTGVVPGDDQFTDNGGSAITSNITAGDYVWDTTGETFKATA